jgi:hypothetical protein
LTFQYQAATAPPPTSSLDHATWFGRQKRIRQAKRKQRKPASAPNPGSGAAGTLEERVQAVLAALEILASESTRQGMARYGTFTEKAFGVPMAAMQRLAKGLGRDHELAAALWNTGWYEARTVAAFVAEPGRLTPAQMDRWCRDFDNWAICDTVCFHLFDRTPHAFGRIAPWSRKPGPGVSTLAWRGKLRTCRHHG